MHKNFDDNYTNEAINVLYSDIGFLIKTMFPRNRPVDEAAVRSAAVVLRRWVADGDLNHLAQRANATITLPALYNDEILQELTSKHNLKFFMTAGVRFEGHPVQGICVFDSPPEVAPEIPVQSMPFSLVSLREFRRQKRIYFKGDFFSCEDIIRFMANKAGGAHLDFNRAEVQKIEAAYRYCSFGGPPPVDELRPDDAMHFQVESKATETLSAFHIEIIAAAASFAQMRINDIQLIKLETKSSWSSRLRKMIGLKNRIKTAVYEKSPSSMLDLGQH